MVSSLFTAGNKTFGTNFCLDLTEKKANNYDISNARICFAASVGAFGAWCSINLHQIWPKFLAIIIPYNFYNSAQICIC